jgi:hypothetical protein
MLSKHDASIAKRLILQKEHDGLTEKVQGEKKDA